MNSQENNNQGSSTGRKSTTKTLETIGQADDNISVSYLSEQDEMEFTDENENESSRSSLDDRVGGSENTDSEIDKRVLEKLTSSKWLKYQKSLRI